MIGDKEWVRFPEVFWHWSGGQWTLERVWRGSASSLSESARRQKGSFGIFFHLERQVIRLRDWHDDSSPLDGHSWPSQRHNPQSSAKLPWDGFHVGNVKYYFLLLYHVLHANVLGDPPSNPCEQMHLQMPFCAFLAEKWQADEIRESYIAPLGAIMYHGGFMRGFTRFYGYPRVSTMFHGVP